jgi:3-oxoadipate enol-lactonase
MRVSANGVAINAVVDGPEGAPWITFLTGIANDHTLWQAHAAALSSGFRILRLDARGHGASSSPRAPYSLQDLVNDVVGAWDALGVKRSVVAGLGLGGVVAAEVGLRHPERASAVVPVSCRAEMTPQYAAIWPPMIAAAKQGGVAAIAEPTLARWFSEAFRREHPAETSAMRAALMRTSLDGYLGCIAALLELDWGRRLAGFRMPVLYVSGELDTVGAPPAVMQSLCDRTPGARHLVLPGATHISVVCNPAAFNDGLRDFLSGQALQ